MWSNFAPTNLKKGRLSLASVGNAGTLYSYDPVGRVTDTWQCTPSGCGNAAYDKHLAYTYDWAGDMTSAGDGAGETLSYNYSAAGELLSIVSPQNTGSPVTILSNMTNGPSGPLSYQLGNGLYSVNQFDTLGRRNGGWVCSGSSSPSCNGGTALYGFTLTTNGSRVNQFCDTVLGGCAALGYDNFNRLTSETATTGSARSDTWTYDRYGNRWAQAPSPVGYSEQASFNAANNQALGFTYDAAGNMLNDGVHTYTYDAEGNMTTVDGGATAKYTYDAGNHRVRSDIGSTSYELLFNLSGQKVSIWNAATGAVVEEDTRMGAAPIALYQGGNLYYEHQDWVGTERMLTNSSGAEAGTYASLPFGDGFTDAGTDLDPYHFAGLDHDYESGLDHAQYREYTGPGGRWLSPDPYDGSYDFSNPQSFNRYAYVMDDPLSFSDPSGQVQNVPCSDNCDSGDDGGIAQIFIDLGEAIASLFGGGGPSFHGSLQPRPSSGDPNWDGNFGESLGIPTGPTAPPFRGGGLADILGLGGSGCEFGACGAGVGSNFTNPSQSVGGQAWGEFGKSILSCAKSSFGLSTAAGVGAVAAGSNILPAGTKIGSFFTPGTSLASQFFRNVLPKEIGPTWAPTLLNPLSKSNVLGGVIGRWVPWIGEALLIKSGADFTSCLWDSDPSF